MNRKNQFSTTQLSEYSILLTKIKYSAQLKSMADSIRLPMTVLLSQTQSKLISSTKMYILIQIQLVFEEILLVGTKSYTIIGRPFVYNARVNATIESISQSQKVIVFKKKRRQGYKKSFGSRNLISTCRINSIVHQLTESVLSNATAIQ